MITISVARDFSPSPAGRYIADGPWPGEVFRDRLLIPAVRQNDIVEVDLDGTSGYGSSFLEEAFGGLIRAGFTKSDIQKKLRIKSSREFYRVKVLNYINSAGK